MDRCFWTAKVIHYYSTCSIFSTFRKRQAIDGIGRTFDKDQLTHGMPYHDAAASQIFYTTAQLSDKFGWIFRRDTTYFALSCKRIFFWFPFSFTIFRSCHLPRSHQLKSILLVLFFGGAEVEPECIWEIYQCHIRIIAHHHRL